MCFMDQLQHGSQYKFVLVGLPYVTLLALTSVWWTKAIDVTYANFIRTNYILQICSQVGQDDDNVWLAELYLNDEFQ